MNNKYLSILSALLLAFTFHACINDLDVTPINPQKVQTFNQDQVFAKIYALWPLTGQTGPHGNSDIYAPDEGRFCLYRLLWNCNEISSDEAICAFGDAETIDLNTNKWTAINSSLKATYDRFYLVVVTCNHFLENTENKTDDYSIKQKAEVRFLRALSYYYLLDMFGNVPFTTKVGTEAPQQIQRADLFKWLVNELRNCENDMFEPRTQPYYRVDKVANWLLMSRLYLNAEVYSGTAKWDSAAYYAKKVINSPYELAGTYRHLFMGDNAGNIDGSTVNTAQKEIIFPLAADGNKTQGWGHSMFLISSTHTNDMGNWGTTEGGWAGNRARPELVKKFFPNPPSVIARDTNMTMVTYPSNVKDDRALFFRKNRTLSVTEITKFKEGYSVIKFSNIRADGKLTHDPRYVDMDIPFMRKSEAYLTYAEAVLRGASPIEGYSALAAVNALRSRAHGKIATQITLTDAEDFTAGKFNIINEWAREFFFEGRRRTDLIRFGMFGGNTSYKWEWKGGEQKGKNFSEDFNLFPIPSSDLNANSNLHQNTGY
jgi:hypothetical protein